MEQGIDDKRLSLMLEEARTVKKLLHEDTFNLAASPEGFGDIGIHEEDRLDADEVEFVIYCTVRILNELYSSDWFPFFWLPIDVTRLHSITLGLAEQSGS